MARGFLGAGGIGRGRGDVIGDGGDGAIGGLGAGGGAVGGASAGVGAECAILGLGLRAAA